jgi:hypothetical protein
VRGLIVVAAVACGSPRVAVVPLSNHSEAARFGRLDELAFLAGCWRDETPHEVITSCWSRRLEGWSGYIETKFARVPDAHRVDFAIREQNGVLVVYVGAPSPREGVELARRDGNRFVFGTQPRILSITPAPSGRLWMSFGCEGYTLGRMR